MRPKKAVAVKRLGQNLLLPVDRDYEVDRNDDHDCVENCEDCFCEGSPLLLLHFHPLAQSEAFGLKNIAQVNFSNSQAQNLLLGFVGLARAYNSHPHYNRLGVPCPQCKSLQQVLLVQSFVECLVWHPPHCHIPL